MFTEEVGSTIEKYAMLRRGDRLLIGVSGGPDSLALLAALVSLRDAYRLSLRVAYVDHRLRPAATHRDVALVRRVGRLWDVPVQILPVSVRKGKGESLEMAARRVRYEALIRCARRHRCNAIALGHTQDDQAETVLMWILRGTGMKGLAGIPPVRQIPSSRGARRPLRIIRPLIRLSRQEVELYVRAHRIRPRRDSTNASVRFRRNRIRHELIPLLESRYNPRIRRHVAQLAEIVREDVEWMDHLAKTEFQKYADVGKGKVLLDRKKLKELPTPLRRRILSYAVEQLQGNRQGFALRHWEMLDQLFLDGVKGGIDLPHQFHARTVEGKAVSLERSL